MLMILSFSLFEQSADEQKLCGTN